MQNMRDIRNRIKGIRETKQITKAMKLISAVKLRKARNQLELALPYFDKVKLTMADILKKSGDISSKYFDERKDKPVKKAGYIVVTADKGMAGAYNHNIIRKTEEIIREEDEYVLYVVGQVGRHHFMRTGAAIDREFDFSVQNPSVFLTREVTEYTVKKFEDGEIDSLSIIYTYMHSTVKLQEVVMNLLPLNADDFREDPGTVGMAAAAGAAGRQEDKRYLLYEPSPLAVFDVLIPKYIKGVIYGTFVEAFTSENSARMTAMESATNNADEILEKLRLYYNRTRQAAITNEISEIIGGTEVLKAGASE